MNRSTAFNSIDSNLQNEANFHRKQAYLKVEMLEVEKLKLLEQLEYSSSKMEHLSQQFTDKMLRKEQENTVIQSRLADLERLNGELIDKIQTQKKSEVHLNNANYNFTQLQKKLDLLNDENEQLRDKLTSISLQNQQLREKWQKCSVSLKNNSNSKSMIKDLEMELKRKSYELNQVKEKYISVTLELTILKEAEQDFKNSVTTKMKQLCDQLKEEEEQKNILANAKNEKCGSCEVLKNEANNLRRLLVQSENALASNNKSNSLTLKLQQDLEVAYSQIQMLQQRNKELLVSNDQLREFQQSEQQLLQSLKSTQYNSQNNSLWPEENLMNKIPEFVKLHQMVTSSIQDLKVQQQFKDLLEELLQKVGNQQYYRQQLEEQQLMYDRLIIKYHQVLKKALPSQQDTSFVSNTSNTQQKKQFNYDLLHQEMPANQQPNKSFNQSDTTPKRHNQGGMLEQKKNSSSFSKRQKYMNHYKMVNEKLNMSFDSGQKHYVP